MRGRRRFCVLVIACTILTGCDMATPTITPTASPLAALQTPETTATPLPPAPSQTSTRMPSATLTPRIIHQSTPGEPSERFESQIIDVDSSAYANSKKVSGGDNFDIGQFERPFNSGSMDEYFPDLDILEARLQQAGNWIYVTIKLAGVPRGRLLSDVYAVEIDVDNDGRGDFLVLAKKPGVTWSVDGVSVLRDANHDVGGSLPVNSDASNTGDGFEQLLFDSGKGYDNDAAWARVNPSDFSSVQIAFKKAVIDNDRAYLWNAWAGESISPALFDYNDHMTLAEAGSPLPSQSQAYPLKGLAELDNTCRWSVGFEPTGGEPGLCPLTIRPAAVGTESFIHGLVWYDRNSNLLQDPGEPGFENLLITVSEDACSAGGKVLTTTQTALNGTYEIRGLVAGTYCLAVSGPLPSNVIPVKGSGPQTVNLKTGQEVKLNFPFVLHNP